MFTMQHYNESAASIRTRLSGFTPETIMVLGSGLGFLADAVENPTRIPYAEIPHFKQSTAPGHEGQLVVGTLSGKNVLIMQGRLHMYEGYTAEEVVFPIRTAKCLGAKNMIITNACGGVNTDYKAGDLVLLHDFIKFAHPNPLTGPNISELGPRFCDMSFPFDAGFRTLAKDIANGQGIRMNEGVYFYTTGPQYETRAEIRAIRTLGGDVVGMSTVPECIAAIHMGMKILGVSLVTNMAAGVLDKPLSEEEVLEQAEKSKTYFSRFILEFLNRI